MKEHALYFAKSEFYELIRNLGGLWNDAKERPLVCLIKSTENDNLYWAIPIGNYEHRNQEAKSRIQNYINKNKKSINTNYLEF